LECSHSYLSTAPGTHPIVRLGLRASLDNMEKWKFLPPPGLKLWPLGRPACSQLLYQLRYPSSWRKLHTVLSGIRMSKSRRMRWVVHVEGWEMFTKVWMGKLEDKSILSSRHRWEDSSWGSSMGKCESSRDSGRFLWIWFRMFRFHNRWAASWQAEWSSK
jgi:hypothetical protein